MADDEVDVVFLGHVLHESDTPLTVLLEAKRCTKKRVAVLEWPYQEKKKGPSIEERMTPNEIIEMAQKVGFQDIEEIQLSYMVFYRFDV